MSKKVLIGSLCVVAAVLITVTALQAGGERTPTPPAREVTMVGKIVDLHCFMTDKFPSADHVKCTRECIRAGVPAALDTEVGLIVLGHGPKGPARMIDELALQHAEIKGKLYERNGLRYLDVTAAKVVSLPEPPKPFDPEIEEEEVEEDFDEPEEAEDFDTGGC
jgi:hypothetical protein